MYIRKVRSRASICYQIGKKVQGKFKLIEHIGCGQNEVELEVLRLKAERKLWQLKFEHQLSLFPRDEKPKAKLIQWRVTGYHQVFGWVYDSVGYPNNLLRDLVIARIVYPKSKIDTVRFLNRALGTDIAKDQVYRFLDTLDKNGITEVAYEFVVNRHEQRNLSLVFYDVTTLYFETDKEDEIRSKSYSKDHRNDMLQILVGLCVD